MPNQLDFLGYVTFKPGNSVRYGQDFTQHIGVPAGVQFEAFRAGSNLIKLVAPGYGVIGGEPGSYGDGALYVSLTANPSDSIELQTQSL